MRNPERIDPIIENLRALWKDVPDVRLGQLLINVIALCPGNPDPFYVEDDVLDLGMAATRMHRGVGRPIGKPEKKPRKRKAKAE